MHDSATPVAGDDGDGGSADDGLADDGLGGLAIDSVDRVAASLKMLLRMTGCASGHVSPGRCAPEYTVVASALADVTIW